MRIWYYKGRKEGTVWRIGGIHKDVHSNDDDDDENRILNEDQRPKQKKKKKKKWWWIDDLNYISGGWVVVVWRIKRSETTTGKQRQQELWISKLSTIRRFGCEWKPHLLIHKHTNKQTNSWWSPSIPSSRSTSAIQSFAFLALPIAFSPKKLQKLRKKRKRKHYV